MTILILACASIILINALAAWLIWKGIPYFQRFMQQLLERNPVLGVCFIAVLFIWLWENEPPFMRWTTGIGLSIIGLALIIRLAMLFIPLIWRRLKRKDEPNG